MLANSLRESFRFDNTKFNQIEKEQESESSSVLNESINSDYKIISSVEPEYDLIFQNGYLLKNLIYETNNDKLFLVSDNENKNKDGKKLYFLNKIFIKSKKMKNQIEKHINILNKIDSEYIIKIVNYFFTKEKTRDIVYIILDYYENDLSTIIYKKNFFLNNRNIWKIFVQILLGLNSLNINGIILEYICPQNIFLDKNNNIKIFCRFFLDLDKLPYLSPEILREENTDEKSCIWSLGCILYELAFKKLAFADKNNANLKKDILSIKYYLPDNCEKDISGILSKSICRKQKRLTIEELIFDEIIRNKIIEFNVFTEIIEYNSNSK